MKKFLLLLVFIPAFMVSCTDDDDETTTYVGNWQKVDRQFGGSMRSNAVTITIADTAYFIGGYFYDNKSRWYKDVWAFVPSDSAYYKKDPLPDEAIIRTGAVGFTIGGKGYYGLGYSGETGGNDAYTKLKDFYEFDPTKPARSQWKKIADFGGTARTGAIGFGANGKGYVITGYDSDNNFPTDTWEFDPNGGANGEGEWVELQGPSVFPASDRINGTYFTINNIVYICTGRSSDNIYTGDFYAFDPAQKKWTKKRKITNSNADESYDDSYTIVRESASAFVMNGKGYITNGSTSSGFSLKSDTWEYDPATDLWTRKTSFEGGARKDASSFSINNRGFVVLGTSGNSSSNFYKNMFEFFPNAEINTYDNE